MEDKFIMVNLDDERSKNIAEILGNKTCRKIIDYLSDVKEASEQDIAKALAIPINTTEYNLKKLIASGLIEKTKNFFWSVKGRKIDMYRLSNKKIVISPRSVLKGIAPAFFAVLLGSFGIKVFTDRLNSNEINNIIQSSGSEVAGVVNAPAVVSSASSAAPAMMDKASAMNIPSQVQSISSGIGIDSWAWFLLGGLFVILVFLLWNYFKTKLKGGLN